MNVDYETQCGNCINYDFKGDDRKGHCSWYGSYFYPGDSCSHQKPRRNSSESSCYITTVVCDLLGKDDNCIALNTLRFFRDNVMQKDEKYAKILYEYDVVGPYIASALKNEYSNTKGKEKFKTIENLYENGILKVVGLIFKEKYDEAVEKYTEMTKWLEEYYGITYMDKVDLDYDYKKGGHGKVYKK